MERARQAHAETDLATAEQLCLEVLELSPGHLEGLTLLYELRKSQQCHTAAEVLLRRIVGLHPNIFWATSELALALLRNGRIAEAELHARNAVRIAPTNPQSHNLLGMILTEANRPQVGEFHYRRVLELTQSRDPIVLANLAWNLKNQGRVTEARALYRESVEVAPWVLQTLLGWARLEEADREFELASELLDRAERSAPGNTDVLLARAVLHGRMREHTKALAVLDALETSKPDGLDSNELIEKGRVLDKMSRYADAFAAYSEAKRKARETTGLAYLADQAAEIAARLRGFFTAERLTIVPRARPVETGPKPIFVLGFPRSGTTLIEQTLTAHPSISAGDELPIIHDITVMMPRMLNSPLNYPEALAELWMGDQHEALDNLRDYYLQRARQAGAAQPDAVWFTDKMPLNETHLGLIALLFPEAPLLHVVRHPLDAVLSVFSNHLTHGFYCALDLETAARHYVLVMELVEHYRSQMGLKYLQVRYEDIVTEQESEVRGILDFVGAEFDPRCLNFHENRRYARTASYAQVTEKLYGSSRFRHRHYLAQLAPVIPILRPVMDRLGYVVA